MENLGSNSERRKTERISQSYPVHASKNLSEALSQERVTGLTRDINSTGLSFLSDEDYSVGDILNLQMDLPASNHHFRARVTHSQKLGDSYVVGVAFLDMSATHQQVLMNELCLR